MDIWTPIPESVAENAREFLSGDAGDLLRKSILSVLLLVLAYALLLMGIVGAFIGGILLSALLEPEIRQAVRDLWDGNWYEIRV